MLSFEVLKDEVARKNQQFASLNILLTKVRQDSDPLPRTGMCFANSRHTQQLLFPALTSLRWIFPSSQESLEWSQPCTCEEHFHFIHESEHITACAVINSCHSAKSEASSRHCCEESRENTQRNHPPFLKHCKKGLAQCWDVILSKMAKQGSTSKAMR